MARILLDMTIGKRAAKVDHRDVLMTHLRERLVGSLVGMAKDHIMQRVPCDGVLAILAAICLAHDVERRMSSSWRGAPSAISIAPCSMRSIASMKAVLFSSASAWAFLSVIFTLNF